MDASGIATTFAALGDPVRSAIVGRLADGDATVDELAALFPITLQAVLQAHRRARGRGRRVPAPEEKAQPMPMEPAVLATSADWLEGHRRRLETKYGKTTRCLATPPTKKEPSR